MKEDPIFKLEVRLRARIYLAFKEANLNKSERTQKYIGCTKLFFRDWITYQFEDGMTENNYGKIWHIDHVKPCSSYDLSNNDEVFECFNWKNCRPMFAEENLKKGSKINEEEIANHYKKAKKYENMFNDEI